MIHVLCTRESREVVLELSGGLDARNVDELVSVALEQPAGSSLIIDISHASGIHGSSLANLADSLSRIPPHTIRGVSRRQAELLAILGERASESDEETGHTD